MGDNNANQQRYFRRVYDIVSKSAPFDHVLVPGDSIQYVRHQQSGVHRESDRDPFQTVPRVRVPAVPAVLPPHVVYGGAGRRLYHHHYNGHRYSLRQKQEL